MLASFAMPSASTAQTAPGTVILNRASIAYIGSSGVTEQAFSNEVVTVTEQARTPASVFFTRVVTGNGTYAEPVGPAACRLNGGFVNLASPTLIGQRTLNPGFVQSLVETHQVHGGEPVFVRLVDRDQNADPSVRDTVSVSFTSQGTNDTEQIQLTETAVDSGVFAGYVPSQSGAARAGDCTLQTALNSSLRVDYVDAEDPGDTASATLNVDPVSRVFNAQTGEPVDGAIITLVDALTGLPASPLADDGVSGFPATVVSGADVVDAAGNVVSLGSGEYRFPVIEAGNYRLQIEAPEGYLAPSQQSEADIQSLSNAPFVIVGGSFGLTFSMADTPVLNIDVPVDPAIGNLFLDKRVGTASASVGDFVEYRVALSHAGGFDTARLAVIEDYLPAGLRYQAGSGRLLPEAVPIEPEISDDGRVLSFSVGDLEPDASITVRYIAAVVPGTNSGELINSAHAFAESAESNEASAALLITDDLFRNESLLAGRVMLGSCTDLSRAEESGLAGARVYLEDGRFAVTDRGGRFHFEGLRPGVHVAQLDVESLPEAVELVPCDEDIRFAGTGFSRIVDLQPGMLGRADFFVRMRPPPSGQIALTLEQSAADQRFDYKLALASEDEIVTDAVQLTVMLPDGVAYAPGSATFADGSSAAIRQSGQALTIDLGDRSGVWRELLMFAAIPDASASGEFSTRAVARFQFDGETISTPMAETKAAITPESVFSREYVLRLNFDTLSAALSAPGRDMLDGLASDWTGVRQLYVEALGHSDSQRISAAGRARFADNYALSRARAESVVSYLAESLGLQRGQVVATGVGPDRPAADNATAEGRAQNRRVELRISGIAADALREVTLVQGDSGLQTVHVEARPEAMPTMTVAADAEIEEPRVESFVPEISLAGQAPGVEILWPDADFFPAIPSTKVIVKHGGGDTVSLYLNGEPVSPLNFEGRETSVDGEVVLSRWRGVDLEDGPNEFLIEVLGEDGRSESLRREVHFAGPPVRGALALEESVLIADGRTRPRLAVRFVDRWGHPARIGTTGGFDIESPYRSWWEIERLRENSVIMSGNQTPTFRVGNDGIAAIELEPTTATGEVKLTIEYAQEYPQEIRAWLRPAAREWILVGLAEGTMGYNEIAGHMELAESAGLQDEYYDDGRLAFFAKGQIKGALLTAAFDSEGDQVDDLDSFGGVIDPDRYYTLYGDSTEQRFDAASREKLYLKIEKDAYFAMYGDFDTGLTVTELSRYSRTLTGLKSEFNGDRVNYSIFAANSDQSFVKDEFAGDGTSGPYQLTHRPILAGSDKLTIEVRDRFRPDLIVSSRPLERHFDYDIDYMSGVIFFREPIASRDFDFNHVYIVADYESRDTADSALLVGGRTGVRIGELGSEVGVSLVHEGTTGAAGTLLGTDLRYRFGIANELTAEFAVTDAEDPSSTVSRDGSAYRIEFEHQQGGRQLQAYVRETDEDFGLGQQRSSEPGTRRSGVQMRNDLSEAWRVEAEAFRQENLADGSRRTVIEGEGRYQDGPRIGSMGVRRVDEEVGDEVRDGTQAFVGGSWKLFDELLTTRISVESLVSGSDSSTDYPTRTLLGLDVEIGDRVTLFGERELAEGADLKTQMTRIGVRAKPTSRSQIDSAVQQEMTEYGPRNFATLGMNQGWNIGERWSLDLGGERSKLLSDPGLQAFDTRVPLASGSLADDFSAGFFGVGYSASDWSFTSRIESRAGNEEDRLGLISGFYRERNAGRGFSAELTLLDRTVGGSADNFDGVLRLGWAHRPADSRWIMLNRADWSALRSVSAESSLRTQRFVNNFNAHFLPNVRQELSVQYAIKYVRSDFDDFEASGLVSLIGLDWRRRLNERFDIGLHTSWYQAIDLDVVERGWGIDVGFSAAKNLLISFGYNFDGFEDEDFARARYTAQGPFAQFRLKVDQASLEDLLRR